MINLLFTELKKNIFSKQFIITVLFGFALLIQPLLNDLFIYAADGSLMTQHMSNIEAYCISILYGSFKMLAPVLCAVPSTYSFCDEHNSNNLLLILHRTNRKNYIISKIISTFISGGLVIFMSLLIFGIYVSLIYLPLDSLNPQDILPLHNSMFRDIYFTPGGYGFLMIEPFIGGLFGSVWAVFGLAISVWWPNIYLAVASPFIMVYSLNLITSRFMHFDSINPTQMFLPIHVDITPDIWYVLTYQLIILSIFIFIFARGYKWRSRKYAF